MNRRDIDTINVKVVAVMLMAAMIISVVSALGIIKAIDIVTGKDFEVYSTVEADNLFNYDDALSEVVFTQENIVPTYRENIVEVNINPIEMEKIGGFNLTAYCPCNICCGQWGGGVEGKTTAIGVGAYDGITFAVDPTVIPYGTKLYIEGVGVGIATDCGGGIKGNRIDVYCTDHTQALQYGRFGNYAHTVYIIHD